MNARPSDVAQKDGAPRLVCAPGIGTGLPVHTRDREVKTVPDQEILCTVNSCYYNEAGQVCKAAKIVVENNSATIHNTRMEIGEMGGEAAQSNQTLCKTFIPKDRGPKPGIARID